MALITPYSYIWDSSLNQKTDFSYEVYCLINRLYPVLCELKLEKYYPVTYNILIDSKMTVIIKFDGINLNSEQINILQNVINETDDEDYLYLIYNIDSITTEDIIIPKKYVNEIIPFINIIPELFPKINNYGILINLSNNKEDFKELYDSLLVEIIAKIRHMYINGYITGITDEQAETWNLTRINNIDLWYPAYYINKLIECYDRSMYEFLSNVIKDKYIMLKININSKYKFENIGNVYYYNIDSYNKYKSILN